jgi:hypothetical protein
MEQIGNYMALIGLVLLLTTTMGRRRARRAAAPPKGLLGLWVQWGDFVAYGLIMAGLWHMWR